METIIGILLILFGILLGGYSYITADFVYDARFYVQMGICFFGPIYIFWDQILSLFKADPNEKEVEEVAIDKEPVPRIPDTTNNEKFYCHRDFTALMYLRQRVNKIESKEALELIVKLNTILFASKFSAKDEV
jgi:hypothetical protein